MKLVVAIHGILTSQTDSSWPDKFHAWCFHNAPNVTVLKKEYRAGPFPRWNVWVKDPRIAKGLANEILEFCEDGNGDLLDSPPEIWFVAHSNGCVIALMTMKRLIERGVRVAGIIFTGGACDAVVERNGIWQWINENKLGYAVAFSSQADIVVKSKFIWPYGHLGATGWQCKAANGLTAWMKHGRAWTGWFSGYGHSGYFSPQNEAATYQRFNDLIQNGAGAAVVQ